jgi:hypothetical protein
VIVFFRIERIIIAGQALRGDRVFVDDPTLKVNPGDKVLTSFSFNGYSYISSIQFFLSPTTHERR